MALAWKVHQVFGIILAFPPFASYEEKLENSLGLLYISGQAYRIIEYTIINSPDLVVIGNQSAIYHVL